MQDPKAQQTTTTEISEEQKRVMEARKKLAEKFGSTSTRLGGKGTPKRKIKVVHHSNASGDKQTKEVIKKLQAQPLQDLSEVNLFTNDMKVMQFKNPEVFGNIANQTFIVQGNHEEKLIKDNFPEFITQLSPNQMKVLKDDMMDKVKQTKDEVADEAPELVDIDNKA